MRYYLYLLIIIVIDCVVTDQKFKDYVEYETNSKKFPTDKIEDVSEIIGHESSAEVATDFDIPVELLSSSKKVGDIEFDVEVQENKRVTPMPEIAVDADPGSLESENLEHSRADEEGEHTGGVSAAMTDNDLSVEDRDDYWAMRHFQGSNLTDDQQNNTNPNPNQEQPPLVPGGSNGKSSSDSDATPSATSEAKSRAIWPLILLAVLFTLLVFVGLCWVVTKYLKSRKQKEKSIGKEEAADADAAVGTVPAEVKAEDTSIQSGDTKRSPDSKGDEKSKSESASTPNESPTSA